MKIKSEYYSGTLFIYDKQFIRQLKLCRITGEEVKPSGDVLFYLDWKNELFECDYDKIWSFFEFNYSSNYQEINKLIKGMLEKHDKFRVLTPETMVWNLTEYCLVSPIKF